MAAVYGNLYDALRSAGVPEDKALKASEELYKETSEIGSLRSGLKTLDERTNRLEGKVDKAISDLSDLKASGAVVRWMIGLNIAMTVALIGKLFLGHGG